MASDGIPASLRPDPDRMKQLLGGKSPVGDGRFWLINFLKFKPGGQGSYDKYLDAVEPVMRKVGGQPVFYSATLRNVVDGAGQFKEWDAVYIGEYPSPRKFAEFFSSDEYAAGHRHRADALADTQLVAAQAAWLSEAGAGVGTTAAAAARKPDYSLKVEDLPPPKTGKKLAAISGDPKMFLRYIRDKRFASGSVWKLNLLTLEPGNGPRWYEEYGIRSASKIASMGSKKPGAPRPPPGTAGLQMVGKVYSLSGPQYHQFALMAYPSRQHFVDYVSQGGMKAAGDAASKKPSGAKRDTDAEDGFKFRVAGLAVQILVAVKPDGAVRDERGPAGFRAAAAKL